MKMIWKCPECGDVVTSDDNERHTMDYCKCKETAVDLEQHYCRFMGDPIVLERIKK